MNRIAGGARGRFNGPERGMLEFSVLGSGSSGNCALVRSGTTTFLLDAGLSARQLNRRIELLGIDPESLGGILITHEHGDHTRGIDVFCRKNPLPVYCTSMTREVVRESIRGGVEWRIFESGGNFVIGDFEIQSFPVPHDAVDPLGFSIRCGGSNLGILSDVGHVTTLVRDRLGGVNALFVEANYDEVLLQNDTRRPWSTKQRIQSKHGHLSNGQTADLVAEVASKDLGRVVLGHLSGDCNDPALACATVSGKLKERGHSHVEVSCASQAEPTPWFQVGEVQKVAVEVEVEVAVAEAAPEPEPLAEQGQFL